MKRIILFLLIAIPILLQAQVKKIKHVIVIGVDGLGANYLAKAGNIRVMQMMMKEGSYTLHARCVSPSSSAANWAAMIMGAGPELTGYTQWDSKTPEIPSRITDEYGKFPSIFGILRAQKPQSTIGVVYTWGGVGYLFPKQAIDNDDPAGKDSLTEAHAVKYIQTNQPTLLFIHFSNVDAAGHGIGWGTPAYYDAITKVDGHIGKIIQSVKDAGILDETVIILSSDHGGVKKEHGGKTLDEMEIPWIIYGKGIRKGEELTQSIMTYDTAATIAWIFGLKTPQAWIGRPVKAAFK